MKNPLGGFCDRLSPCPLEPALVSLNPIFDVNVCLVQSKRGGLPRQSSPTFQNRQGSIWILIDFQCKDIFAEKPRQLLVTTHKSLKIAALMPEAFLFDPWIYLASMNTGAPIFV